MAEVMRAFHVAQGSDLGPWQTDAESKDLANEIRDRLGIPRVDYNGKLSPESKKALFGDSEARPRKAVIVGQTASLDEALAMLRGRGRN